MLTKLISLFRKNKESESKKKMLFLHIGMGKTGTTALQEFFWENRSNLREYGIEYPEYGAVSCAHHLISPHVPKFLVVDWQFMKPEEWCPKMVQMDAKKLLLSSELIAWASPEVVSEFCKEVAKWFDIKVVIYLRRQDSLIMAGYNQQIKAGTQKRHIDHIIDQQFKRFDYEAKIEPWALKFGKRNIIVLPYEKQQFFMGDIRYDFLSKVFGINNTSAFKVANNNSNPRLSYEAMAYKRWINNLIEDTSVSSQFNSVLLEYSATTDESSTSIYSNHSILSPSERLKILSRFESTNKAIAKDFLNRPDGKLFYDEVPNENEAWTSPEISPEILNNITEYIKQKNPDLYDTLQQHKENLADSDFFVLLKKVQNSRRKDFKWN